MFKPESKIERINTTVRLAPEPKVMLTQLAEAYNTSLGKIIEALVQTYGPGLLRQAEQEADK